MSRTTLLSYSLLTVCLMAVSSPVFAADTAELEAVRAKMMALVRSSAGEYA